jgi:hypothetical protein
MGISPTKKTIFTVRLYVKKWTTGFRRNNVGRESRMSLNVKYFHVLRILYDLEVSLLILGLTMFGWLVYTIPITALTLKNLHYSISGW